MIDGTLKNNAWSSWHSSFISRRRASANEDYAHMHGLTPFLLLPGCRFIVSYSEISVSNVPDDPEPSTSPEDPELIDTASAVIRRKGDDIAGFPEVNPGHAPDRPESGGRPEDAGQAGSEPIVIAGHESITVSAEVDPADLS